MSNNLKEYKFCVTATYDNKPNANHTAWFKTYEEAETYYEQSDAPDANIAIGKVLTLEEARLFRGEVCFAFDDGTESVWNGEEIEEKYKKLPLITYDV